MRTVKTRSLFFTLLVYSCFTICASAGTDEPVKPNVVIILIDMLRPDRLGCYGYARDTSPNIDLLAKDGIVFENVISPCSWTWPATASLITGVWPEIHGCLDRRDRLSDRFTTLTEVLREGGYHTAAFTASPYLKKNLNFSQGFDDYEDGFVGSRFEEWWGERMLIENINPHVYEWLREKRTEPFFLYLHYIDVHGPYLKPEPFEADGIQTGKRINEYDGAIRHTDRYIGELFDVMKDLGIFDRTIVVVTADHGITQSEYNVEDDHGHYLYDEQIKVPLIIHNRSLFPEPARITQQVRLIDVMPTILDVVHLPVPDHISAESLTPFIYGDPGGQESRIAFSTTGLDKTAAASVRLDNTWKLVKIWGHRWRYLCGTYLFNVSSPGYPEKTNLIKEEPALASDLGARLDAYFDDCAEYGEQTENVEDEQLEDALRSLGYAQKPKKSCFNIIFVIRYLC